MKPKVSVVMPVYNCERYVEGAIRSILGQTFGDFEFIIINDGSTDATGKILRRYQEIDNRIHVFDQGRLGLGEALNKGCQIAQGEYIARMDADDISLPERLAKQVEYMNLHPEIGILGTCIERINENGVHIDNACYPTSPGVIGWNLIFWNCIIHPSVLMRRNVIEKIGFYNVNYSPSEDYYLWLCATFVTKIANLPHILIQHRIWKGSTISRNFEKQHERHLKARKSMIARLLEAEISEETVLIFDRVFNYFSFKNIKEVELSIGLMRRLYRVYLKAHSLNGAEAKEVANNVSQRLYNIGRQVSKYSLVGGLVLLAEAIKMNPTYFLNKLFEKSRSR